MMKCVSYFQDGSRTMLETIIFLDQCKRKSKNGIRENNWLSELRT